jgi:hypothetical protein
MTREPGHDVTQMMERVPPAFPTSGDAFPCATTVPDLKRIVGTVGTIGAKAGTVRPYGGWMLGRCGGGEGGVGGVE